MIHQQTPHFGKKSHFTFFNMGFQINTTTQQTTRFISAHSMLLQQAFENKYCLDEAIDNCSFEKSRPVTYKFTNPDIIFFFFFFCYMKPKKMPVNSNNGNEENILYRRSQLSRTRGMLNRRFHSTNPTRNIPFLPCFITLNENSIKKKKAEKRGRILDTNPLQDTAMRFHIRC